MKLLGKAIQKYNLSWKNTKIALKVKGQGQMSTTNMFSLRVFLWFMISVSEIST